MGNAAKGLKGEIARIKEMCEALKKGKGVRRVVYLKAANGVTPYYVLSYDLSKHEKVLKDFERIAGRISHIEMVE